MSQVNSNVKDRLLEQVNSILDKKPDQDFIDIDADLFICLSKGDLKGLKTSAPALIPATGKSFTISPARAVARSVMARRVMGLILTLAFFG